MTPSFFCVEKRMKRFSIRYLHKFLSRLCAYTTTRNLIMQGYYIINTGYMDENPQDDGENSWRWRAIGSLSSFNIPPRPTKEKAQKITEIFFFYLLPFTRRTFHFGNGKNRIFLLLSCLFKKTMLVMFSLKALSNKFTSIHSFNWYDKENKKSIKQGESKDIASWDIEHVFVANWRNLSQSSRKNFRKGFNKVEIVFRPVSLTIVDVLVAEQQSWNQLLC